MYIHCINIFERNIYVRSKFSCVRSSHGLCVRTRAQLRGNIHKHIHKKVTPTKIKSCGVVKEFQWRIPHSHVITCTSM